MARVFYAKDRAQCRHLCIGEAPSRTFTEGFRPKLTENTKCRRENVEVRLSCPDKTVTVFETNDGFIIKTSFVFLI